MSLGRLPLVVALVQSPTFLPFHTVPSVSAISESCIFECSLADEVEQPPTPRFFCLVSDTRSYSHFTPLLPDNSAPVHSSVGQILCVPLVFPVGTDPTESGEFE